VPNEQEILVFIESKHHCFGRNTGTGFFAKQSECLGARLALGRQ
jgi:hypothetical protein